MDCVERGSDRTDIFFFLMQYVRLSERIWQYFGNGMHFGAFRFLRCKNIANEELAEWVPAYNLFDVQLSNFVRMSNILLPIKQTKKCLSYRCHQFHLLFYLHIDLCVRALAFYNIFQLTDTYYYYYYGMLGTTVFLNPRLKTLWVQHLYLVVFKLML